MTNRFLRPALAALIAIAWLPAPAGRSAQTTRNQVFDTSYAVENSQACLGGAPLQPGHPSAARDCIACHGLHVFPARRWSARSLNDLRRVGWIGAAGA